MEWVAYVRKRASKLNPLATLEEIWEIEENLGLSLPESLRHVYLEIGNGALFEHFGLMGLKEVAKTYSSFRSTFVTYTGHEWPQHLIPFCSGGCDLLYVIERSSNRIGFIQYEVIGPSDSESVEDIVEWQSSSLSDWFTAGMSDRNPMTYSETFWDSTIEKILLRNS